MCSRLVWLPLVVGLALAAPAAEAARGYLGAEAGFTSGDYGTGQRSDLYSLYAHGGVVAEDWDLGATMPLHLLSTEGEDTEVGPGDLILRAGHVLMPASDDGLSLYGSAALKLPTGDEDAGLSTGETDLGGFLSLRQRWDGFQGRLYAGYTLIGDPPGTDYNNTTTLGIQGFARTGAAWLYAGGEWRRALLDADEDPAELFFGGFGPVAPDLALTAEGFIGLTEGSPDAGARLGFIHWF